MTTLTPDQHAAITEALEACPDCGGHRMRVAPIRVADPTALVGPDGQPQIMQKLVTVPCPRCAPVIHFLEKLTGQDFPRKDDDPEAET